MSSVFDPGHPLRRSIILILTVLVLAVCGWMSRGFWRKSDPVLNTPRLAIETLQARSLYFNAAARPWLLTQHPDLLSPEDRAENSPNARSFGQATQNFRLFRQLDRRSHFDAVLLTGDPSEYRPLLDHLVETKDWKLSYADHSSLVFRRDAPRGWELADFAPVRAQLAGKSAREQASALAQTATKLLAAGQPDAGRDLLSEATRLDSKNSEVANGLAIYHLGRADWHEAETQVARALAADGNSLPALATKAQLLYATKRFSEAFELSRRLIAQRPNDPGLLFYHAKIAHEAGAYRAEIEALETLIAAADREDYPVGGYLLYLGQAYATVGDAERSVESLMRALNDPDLPNDQRAFARETIARIKKRTGP